MPLLPPAARGQRLRRLRARALSTTRAPDSAFVRGAAMRGDRADQPSLGHGRAFASFLSHPQISFGDPCARFPRNMTQAPRARAIPLRVPVHRDPSRQHGGLYSELRHEARAGGALAPGQALTGADGMEDGGEGGVGRRGGVRMGGDADRWPSGARPLRPLDLKQFERTCHTLAQAEEAR